MLSLARWQLLSIKYFFFFFLSQMYSGRLFLFKCFYFIYPCSVLSCHDAICIIFFPINSAKPGMEGIILYKYWICVLKCSYSLLRCHNCFNYLCRRRFELSRVVLLLLQTAAAVSAERIDVGAFGRACSLFVWPERNESENRLFGYVNVDSLFFSPPFLPREYHGSVCVKAVLSAAVCGPFILATLQ